MNNIIKYSILKYNHSPILNEHIAVGIIFLNPKKQKVHFSFPKTLKRLNSFYQNFDEHVVGTFLRSFQTTATEISQQINNDVVDGSIENLIHNFFLIKNSSSLQFDKPKSVILDDDFEFDELIKRCENTYLSEFKLNQIDVIRKDENYIRKQFKTTLANKSPKAIQHLNPGFSVKDPSSRTEIKVDFSWQNTVEHLVKPLSFDLVDPTAINHKAVLHHGLLNFISDYAISKGYFFDLLLSSPTNNDKELLSAYRKAIEILSKSKAKFNIYEESEFEDYSALAVNEIEKHNQR